MDEPLQLSAKNPIVGLGIYCNGCKCFHKTEKALRNCPYPFGQKYKITVHVPGTRNERLTKVFETRNEVEVKIQALEYIDAVKRGLIVGRKQPIQNQETERIATQPKLFIECAAAYCGWLKGENIPAHHKKHIRTEAHVRDVERELTTFIACMQRNGKDMKNTNVDEITDNMVALFHGYLLNEKKYEARTYNKYVSGLTSFMNWSQRHLGIPVTNYFEQAERKDTVGRNPETASYAELQQLFEITRPENGIKTYPNGNKRYLYHDYLVPAWKLESEIGVRREELIQITFKNINIDPDGTRYIRIEDFKSNRLRNRTSENSKKYKFIPITASLWNLLQEEFDYDEYKDTDRFLIAPEIQHNRVRVLSDSITKGFSHFYGRLNTGKRLTFYSLRRTYITSLSSFMRNPRAITGHSSDDVLYDHYINREAIAKAANEFSVYSQDEIRRASLKEARDTQSKDGKEMER